MVRDFSIILKIPVGINNAYILNDSVFLLCTIKGLYTYHNLSNRLEKVKSGNNFTFRNMTISPGGNVFMLTYGNGYFLYRGDSLIAMPLDKNENLRYPHTIISDSLGFVWISTNNGLFQVREDDLIGFANKETEKVYLHYYDETYGFKTNEFNGGGTQSGLIAPDGNLYLASLRGLVTLNPYQIKPRLPHLPIFIQEVTINGRKVEQLEKLTLEKGFRNLKIKIHTPYYGHPGNLDISYRIRGNSDTWTQLGNNFEVEIPTLKGGDYELQFKKLNGFGRNNFSIKSISIKVKPFMYERLVFYYIMIAAIFLILYFFYRFRTINLLKIQKKLEAEVQYRTIELRESLLNLEERNQEISSQKDMLNTVYGVVTHDLISPLRFLRRAVLRLGEIPQTEMKRQMDIILHTTAHAEEFVNDLLVWIKLNHDSALANMKEITPAELIGKNINLFLWLANERGVELRHDPPFMDTPLRLSEELMSILIRNFLDNALKNTVKGIISIKAYIEEDMLNIFIEDTGKGIPPNIVQQINSRNIPYLLTVKNHMGMKIIFDILGILNGELYIQSELKKGTIVHLKIPVVFEPPAG